MANRYFFALILYKKDLDMPRIAQVVIPGMSHQATQREPVLDLDSEDFIARENGKQVVSCVSKT